MNIYIYGYIYICIYGCVWKCIYICTCIYTHVRKQTKTALPGAERGSYPSGFGDEAEEHLLSIRDNRLANSLGIPLPLGGVPFPLGVPTPLNFLPCILECGAVVIRDGLSPRNSLGVPLPLGGVPPPLDVLGLLLECGAVVPLEGVLPLLELLPLSSAHTPSHTDTYT